MVDKNDFLVKCFGREGLRHLQSRSVLSLTQTLVVGMSYPLSC